MHKRGDKGVGPSLSFCGHFWRPFLLVFTQISASILSLVWFLLLVPFASRLWHCEFWTPPPSKFTKSIFCIFHAAAEETSLGNSKNQPKVLLQKVFLIPGPHRNTEKGALH